MRLPLSSILSASSRVQVVPFWIRIAFNPQTATPDKYFSNASVDMTALRIIEALASIRLLKLCRYYEGAGLLMRALGRSVEQLYVPMFMLLIMVICFSTVLYELEYDRTIHDCAALWRTQNVTSLFLRSQPRGVDWGCDVCSDDVSAMVVDGNVTRDMLCATCVGYPEGHPECLGVPFAQEFVTIPAAMWFMVVTITTTGFGDMVPTSPLGQLFTCGIILLGVVFIAMPLATVGNAFTSVYEERQLVKLQALTRQLLSENDISPDDCAEAFKQFDTDGNGLVDATEFAFFVTNVLGLKLKKAELHQLWKMIDVSASGSINFHEFTSVLFPQSAMNLVKGKNACECAATTAACVPGAFGVGAPSTERSGVSGGSPISSARPVNQMTQIGSQIKAVAASVSMRCDETDTRVRRMESLLEQVYARLLNAPDAAVVPRGHRMGRRSSFTAFGGLPTLASGGSGGGGMSGGGDSTCSGSSGGNNERDDSNGDEKPNHAVPAFRGRRNSWTEGHSTKHRRLQHLEGRRVTPPGALEAAARAATAAGSDERDRAERDEDSFFKEANGRAGPLELRSISQKSTPPRNGRRARVTSKIFDAKDFAAATAQQAAATVLGSVAKAERRTSGGSRDRSRSGSKDGGGMESDAAFAAAVTSAVEASIPAIAAAVASALKEQKQQVRSLAPTGSVGSTMTGSGRFLVDRPDEHQKFSC